MKNLWKGNISFGLINIPIRLHRAYKGTDLHFNLIDSRDKSKIHYERINENTGEEVPWDKVVRAYQLSKNRFVFIKDKNVTPINSTNINIAMFVNASEINPMFFDKPYYLIPDGNNLKTYILLREVLLRTHKVGIAKIIIRSRDHIASIYPYQNILVLQLLRYFQEFIKISDLNPPNIDIGSNKPSLKEMELANKLITHMTHRWQSNIYQDESQKKMLALIKEQIKKKKPLALSKKENDEYPKEPKQDIATLLEKSLPKNKTRKI